MTPFIYPVEYGRAPAGFKEVAPARKLSHGVAYKVSVSGDGVGVLYFITKDAGDGKVKVLAFPYYESLRETLRKPR